MADDITRYFSKKLLGTSYSAETGLWIYRQPPEAVFSNADVAHGQGFSTVTIVTGALSNLLEGRLIHKVREYEYPKMFQKINLEAWAHYGEFCRWIIDMSVDAPIPQKIQMIRSWSEETSDF